MKHFMNISAYIVAVYLIASLISSCSLVGYGVGSLIDSGNKEKHSLRAGDDLGKDEGNEAIFYKKNDSKYEGTYQGTVLESESNYRSLYELRRAADLEGILFPLGSELHLQMQKSGDQTIEFHGYARNGIIDGRKGVICYNDISWITDAQNNRIASSQAKRMSSEGTLPLRDAFYGDKNKLVNISANDISDIVVTSSTHWSGILTGIGVLVDIILLVPFIKGGETSYRNEWDFHWTKFF